MGLKPETKADITKGHKSHHSSLLCNLQYLNNKIIYKLNTTVSQK